MRWLLVFLIPLISCQPLPKDVPLDKYRRQYIQGQVFIDEALKNKVPKGDKFLIISVMDLENPMPIAVLRVKNPKFPYSFKITGKQKLRHDRLMEGEVTLVARLSNSADAQAKKGDLIGSARAKVGTRGVRIAINSEVE